MSRFFVIIIVLHLGFTSFCQAQNSWEKKYLTEKERINLFVISEMYGFARYFYPNPQNDKIDWTKFLMYAIEKAETATNDTELLNILNELFIPLIPSALFKEDSLPVHFQPPKESKGFYVRSHYPPGRLLRIRDSRNGTGAVNIRICNSAVSFRFYFIFRIENAYTQDCHIANAARRNSLIIPPNETDIFNIPFLTKIIKV